MSEQRIILGRRWLSMLAGHIGVVAARTGTHDPASEEWKAYVAPVLGFDTEADEQFVANWGAPLLPQEAAGFFPELDISQYKRS